MNSDVASVPFLQVVGVHKRFTGVHALRGVSLSFQRGQIYHLLGENGCGKSTLIKIIAGAQPPDEGELIIGGVSHARLSALESLAGQQITLKTPADGIRQGIGYVPEDRLSEGLFLDKPIRDNIVTAVLSRLRGRFGSLDARKSQALAERTVSDLQIATPDVDRPVQSLSGGNQQRVLIGRWLAIDPRVLILHGPTVGVDVGSKDTIYRIVQRLAEQGLGVILVSDDLQELLQNCDRILLMRKGRIAHDFEAQGLAESELYRALVSDTAIPSPAFS